MTLSEVGRITIETPEGVLSGGLVWTVQDEDAVRRYHAHLKADGIEDCELWESTRAGKTTVSCSYRRDGLSVTVRAEAS